MSGKKEKKETLTSRINVRSMILPSLYLVLAVTLAVLSSWANRSGQFRTSGILAVVALLLAGVVCLTLVPRLYKRVRGEFSSAAQSFSVTRRGGLYLMTVLGIAFASVNTGNNLLILVLSVLLAALIASGVVANSVLRRLKITLNLPNNIHAHQRVILFLTLENLKKRLPSFAIHLSGRFLHAGRARDVAEGPETSFPFIPAQGAEQVRVDCRFPRRGVYSVEGFQVRTAFPFGFFQRGRKLDVQGQIVVYPSLIDLEALWLAFPRLRDGLRESPHKGIGNSLYNIRPYRSGDMARFVHWKSSARQGQLMVKDFARDVDEPLNVIFSTYLPRPGEEAEARFEDAVSCVASLAAYFQQRGRRFAFTSGEYQAELKGRPHAYEGLMQYLAQVSPSPKKLIRKLPADGPSILIAAGDTLQGDGMATIDYLKMPRLRQPKAAPSHLEASRREAAGM